MRVLIRACFDRSDCRNIALAGASQRRGAIRVATFRRNVASLIPTEAMARPQLLDDLLRRVAVRAPKSRELYRYHLDRLAGMDELVAGRGRN